MKLSKQVKCLKTVQRNALLSFITDFKTIRKLLGHLGLWTETLYRASLTPNHDSQEAETEAEFVYEPFDNSWPGLEGEIAVSLK